MSKDAPVDFRRLYMEKIKTKKISRAFELTKSVPANLKTTLQAGSIYMSDAGAASTIEQ